MNMNAHTAGTLAIQQERIRQITKKGYTTEHDAGMSVADLLSASAAFALWAAGDANAHTLWPRGTGPWRAPPSPRVAAAMAGAMAAAAIDLIEFQYGRRG